jgi:hypothetical protein
MSLSPSPARRLSPLGCVLIAAAALVLPGCGDDSAATAGSTASTAATTKPGAKANATAGGCSRQLDAFVDSLDTLRRRLAVGLSYEQYAAKVKALQRGYDDLPIRHLTLGCLTKTGTPAEAALNKYIDAANAWGECLADASCTTATIEPVLQRKWRVASGSLSEAR